MAKYDLKFELEYLMSYNATLSPPEIIGPVPEGLRMNVYTATSGGEVTGPKIQGEVLPVGGDWSTLRTDGIAILNVRATIKTNDGALIYCHCTGNADLGENAYQRILKGESEPKEGYVHTNPWFSTAQPNYTWLNRLFCVGIGKTAADLSNIVYDVYAVR